MSNRGDRDDRSARSARGGPSGARGEREPRELPAECLRLAATLRELRAATGLSLVGLAAKTPYSKSSWDRYLNARAMPPRDAVERLCALAGREEQRPIALWELAENAWSGRDCPSVRPGKRAARRQDAPRHTPGRTTAPPVDPRRTRPPFPWLHAAALGGAAALAAGLLIALLPSGDRPAEDHASTTGLTIPSVGCHGASCEGKNAEDQDCSTARTPPVELGEHRFAGTVVKIRRSEVCETVWARIDRGVAGDRVEILAPGSRAHHAVVQDEFDETGSVSTAMAAAPEKALNRVQACLVREDGRHCFSATPP
ncbi:helix-turn-helix domain-containing protein [Streptomyces sp. NPDC057554]|uniref:helix-turn-helix domain-containing protein n=1 Tax=Streptomyces sp. NPDC057554 TaxID=3350538 RepID=UPI003693A31E